VTGARREYRDQGKKTLILPVKPNRGPGLADHHVAHQQSQRSSGNGKEKKEKAACFDERG